MPLPAGLTKQSAARYRQIAAIPVARLEKYLEWAEATGSVLTSSGALGFVPRPKRSAESVSILQSFCEVLGIADLLVGDAPIPARVRAPTGSIPPFRSGVVIVAECREPATWLRTLARDLADRRVRDAVVVLPGGLGHAWQREIAGWCLLSSEWQRGPAFTAFRGSHAAGLRVALRQRGVIVSADP